MIHPPMHGPLTPPYPVPCAGATLQPMNAVHPNETRLQELLELQRRRLSQGGPAPGAYEVRERGRTLTHICDTCAHMRARTHTQVHTHTLLSKIRLSSTSPSMGARTALAAPTSTPSPACPPACLHTEHAPPPAHPLPPPPPPRARRALHHPGQRAHHARQGDCGAHTERGRLGAGARCGPKGRAAPAACRSTPLARQWWLLPAWWEAAGVGPRAEGVRAWPQRSLGGCRQACACQGPWLREAPSAPRFARVAAAVVAAAAAAAAGCRGQGPGVRQCLHAVGKGRKACACCTGHPPRGSSQMI